MSEAAPHPGGSDEGEGSPDGANAGEVALLTLLARLRAQTWRRQAACRGVNPELFYPGRGDRESLEEAKAICAGCPVREQCAEAGGRELFGVWGGLSNHERRRKRGR